MVAKLKGKNFNCLEITAVIEKHFLGISFLSITANSRHVQESPYLLPIEGPAFTPAGAEASNSTGHWRDTASRRSARKQDAAVARSSRLVEIQK
jgi:hypothetical protein